MKFFRSRLFFHGEQFTYILPAPPQMGGNSSTEAVLRVAISCKIMKNRDFFEKMLRKHQCSAHLGTSDVVLSDYLVLWRHNLDQKKVFG